MDLDAAYASFANHIVDLGGKVEGWAETAISMLPNLVVAALVVAAFVGLGSLLSRAARRTLGRVSDNRQVANLVASGAKIGTVVGGVFVALSVLQLEKTVTSLLAGVGILGLALGFAFQDIFANLMSGVILAFRQPFRSGDLVRVADRMGTIERVDISVTWLRLLTGERVAVPNKQILQDVVENLSSSGRRRVDLSVGVAYGDSLPEVRRVLVGCLRDIEGRDPEREPEVFATGFGASSIDFTVRLWAEEKRTGQRDFLAIRSDAIFAIKAAFDEHGITIPFPIRTLDFGVVGGQRLDETEAAIRLVPAREASADAAE